jgi:glycosyltransferase involved in cell wall biosynthesis
VKREVESLRQIGLQVDVFHYQGGWSPVAYARATAQFHRQLRNQAYDLVHIRFGQCGIVALTQRRLPIVVRFGGSDLLGWRDEDGHEPIASKLLRAVSRTVARRATEVIIVSESMASQLPERRYHVIPSGIDLEQFRPINPAAARAQLGLPAHRKLILFAANPERRVKRFDVAQAAMALLDPALDAELVVAANVGHEQMPLYMSACDVLLLTSDHEGSPNVVKEALACNLPVVSVDVGDVRERLDGLPGCYICADRRPQTIAAALAESLSLPARPLLRDSVCHLETTRLAKQVAEVYVCALTDGERQPITHASS